MPAPSHNRFPSLHRSKTPFQNPLAAPRPKTGFFSKARDAFQSVPVKNTARFLKEKGTASAAWLKRPLWCAPLLGLVPDQPWQNRLPDENGICTGHFTDTPEVRQTLDLAERYSDPDHSSYKPNDYYGWYFEFRDFILERSCTDPFTGIAFAPRTSLRVDEHGHLVRGVAAPNQSYRGLPIVPGTNVYFASMLAKPTLTVRVDQDAFGPPVTSIVRFYPWYSSASLVVTPLENATWKGVTYAAGEDISYSPDGNGPDEFVTAAPLTLNGVTFPAGTRIQKDQQGALYRAVNPHLTEAEAATFPGIFDLRRGIAYENGEAESGVLRETTEIKGVPFAGGNRFVHYEAGGEGTLARDTVFQGHVYAGGSTFTLIPKSYGIEGALAGAQEFVLNGRSYLLDEGPIHLNWDIKGTRYLNGHLTEPAESHGAVFAADGDNEFVDYDVLIDENGVIRQGILEKPLRLPHMTIPAGSRLTRDGEGKPLAVGLSKNAASGGVVFLNMEENPTDNWISEDGMILSGMTVTPVRLPPLTIPAGTLIERDENGRLLKAELEDGGTAFGSVILPESDVLTISLTDGRTALLVEIHDVDAVIVSHTWQSGKSIPHEAFLEWGQKALVTADGTVTIYPRVLPD